MKAKSKSSKKVAKKPVAKKKVTSPVSKKKAPRKSVNKVAAEKKSRKAAPGKTAKNPVVKKRSALTTRKKKTPLKPAKKSPAIKKTVAAETPTAIIQETIVTVTATMPGNGFPSAPSGLLVGKVTHYYNHSSVAIVELEAGNLHVGDTIHVKGHTTDFEQVVESMEIEHQSIETAEAGQTVGVKVRDAVREHDRVYKKEG